MDYLDMSQRNEAIFYAFMEPETSNRLDAGARPCPSAPLTSQVELDIYGLYGWDLFMDLIRWLISQYFNVFHFNGNMGKPQPTQATSIWVNIGM